MVLVLERGAAKVNDFDVTVVWQRPGGRPKQRDTLVSNQADQHPDCSNAGLYFRRA